MTDGLHLALQDAGWEDVVIPALDLARARAACTEYLALRFLGGQAGRAVREAASASEETPASVVRLDGRDGPPLLVAGDTILNHEEAIWLAAVLAAQEPSGL